MKIPHHIARILWIPILICIVGVPVVSWLLHTSFETVSLMTLIGQGAGIIGAQLFATALLLSIRHRYIEYFFGGLDRLYVMHHRIGVIAFSLLAFHPLVLAFRSLKSGVENVMWYLVPVNNSLAKDLGIYALLLMLVLLFITFYGVIFSYRSLKNMHRFMGLAFFLATLHMFLIPSTISTDMILRYSCLGMAGVGLLAYTYRTLLGGVLARRYLYVVSLVKTIGQNIFEITLTPKDEKLTHLPGQFAMLTFLDSSVISNEEHPFTISTGKGDGTLRFSVRGLGDYTSLLGNLMVGTTARIEGPYGEFYYGYGTKSQVWVAGGIGVTPFVSMAEDILKQDVLTYTIDFYYSVRTQADAAYQELFTSVTQKHPSFSFHLVPSNTSGFVTGDGIMKDIQDAVTRSFFICGPPPMMEALIRSLTTLGVKKKLIHSEKFSLLK